MSVSVKIAEKKKKFKVKFIFFFNTVQLPAVYDIISTCKV